ncbi:hypothetical protein AAL_06777 [Moelleriella libera RCEF 2490]|uniref:Uncharacterized protein n=1 Tax=Moelleriella libera RCEF 2490 TaxID=1081109 RepID=A0A167Y9S0_9HYPO|nr:hypothetical protein AAL_06777 [Moelleriella libera RCEF 2490]
MGASPQHLLPLPVKGHGPKKTHDSEKHHKRHSIMAAPTDHLDLSRKSYHGGAAFSRPLLSSLKCQIMTTSLDISSSNNSPPQLSRRFATAVPAGTEATAQLLHKHLGHWGLDAGARRARLVELDVLITALTAAVLTLSELETRLETMLLQANELGLAAVDELCHRLSRPLAKDANRISMLEFTVAKLLGVLKSSNDDEALRHKSLAHFAVVDMLQADSTLAHRLRHLQDSSRAITLLVSQERQHELASRPPPSYSVPGGVVVPQPGGQEQQLPDYQQALDDRSSVAIHPHDWCVFSGLTLADIPVLSRITLPVIRGEIKDGFFYTERYARSVGDALGALADNPNLERSRHTLPEILRLKEPTRDSRGFTALPPPPTPAAAAAAAAVAEELQPQQQRSKSGRRGLAQRLAQRIAKGRR